jgi:hypothetical protein
MLLFAFGNYRLLFCEPFKARSFSISLVAYGVLRYHLGRLRTFPKINSLCLFSNVPKDQERNYSSCFFECFSKETFQRSKEKLFIVFLCVLAKRSLETLRALSYFSYMRSPNRCILYLPGQSPLCE